MKTLLAMLLAGLVTLPAMAVPCSPLDYAEMKDMSERELLTEWCSMQKVFSANWDDRISALGRGGSKSAEDDAASCSAQMDRIKRVLLNKGREPEAMSVSAMCGR